MAFSDSDYDAVVEVVSSMLVSSGGDAGKIMLNAYRTIVAEGDPLLRTMKTEFIEKVRISYVSSNGLK